MRCHVAAAIFALPFVAGPVISAQPPFGANLAQLQKEAQAQTDIALPRLNHLLDKIAYADLAQRSQAISTIKTREQALQRQADVRRRIIELVGGIPALAGPVNVKRFATVDETGFRIENIAYESAPDYWVTANVYIPPGRGPFPALVIAPGHGAGKAFNFNWAANFARAGVLVLSIDPMGQGERLQHFDPQLGTSKVEPSGEHEHANQTTLLVGQHIARYWFADGIRAVDYLTARPDVDPKHIGTFGCSGGGTAAAYLTAMDPRICVGVASSYITSFKELLPGNGPQDAEQTLPSFIASGLDFADWVELAAPRPFAITCFDEDFFPLAGAKQTYAEAKEFYAHFDAADRLALINGPGGHCNLGPVMPQVLTFLFRYLKGPDASIPTFASLHPKDPDEITVTPTGQVATSIPGAMTAEDIARRESIVAEKPPASLLALAALQPRLATDIRSLAAVTAKPGEPVRVTVAENQKGNGYRLDRVVLETEPDFTLEARLAVPEQPGPHPIVLWMDPAPLTRTVDSPDFIRLAKSGRLVMAFQPRGVLGDPPPNSSQLALGQYMQPLLRALVVGRTLIGLRTDDTIRALNYLASRPDADASHLTVYGKGAEGIVALHAAVLDGRITAVIVDRAPVSYRAALHAGLHKNLSEIVIPGVLKHYDTIDLIDAIAPRPVTIVDPMNPMAQPMPRKAAETELSAALEFDRLLGAPERVKILRRNLGDPLPIE